MSIIHLSEKLPTKFFLSKNNQPNVYQYIFTYFSDVPMVYCFMIHSSKNYIAYSI